jgi:hypothetical protein
MAAIEESVQGHEPGSAVNVSSDFGQFALDQIKIEKARVHRPLAFAILTIVNPHVECCLRMIWSLFDTNGYTLLTRSM